MARQLPRSFFACPVPAEAAVPQGPRAVPSLVTLAAEAVGKAAALQLRDSVDFAMAGSPRTAQVMRNVNLSALYNTSVKSIEEHVLTRMNGKSKRRVAIQMAGTVKRTVGDYQTLLDHDYIMFHVLDSGGDPERVLGERVLFGNLPDTVASAFHHWHQVKSSRRHQCERDCFGATVLHLSLNEVDELEDSFEYLVGQNECYTREGIANSDDEDIFDEAMEGYRDQVF